VSNLEPHPQEALCGGTTDVASSAVRELLIGRDVVLGGTRGMPVTRTLPNKHRRMVGAWCFVDHYRGEVAMQVPPHPHTQLQTVTWLVEGDVRHRDSIGSDQVIRPGQLNLMTAGRGIAHAEQSQEPGGMLHGVQLWVALPSAATTTAPDFAHHASLPTWSDGPVTTKVVIGTLDGATSPAHAYSPLLGAEVAFTGPGRTEVPLEPDFEYAALTLDGTVDVDGEPLSTGPLLYLGTSRDRLTLAAAAPARLLLLGGEPFAEEIIMWWNFIGRSHEEIVASRDDWMAGRRFGAVSFEGDPLPAPELPTTVLKPRGRLR
jgi:redox-sensitive bicupin YhaK (pirin superfamily)